MTGNDTASVIYLALCLLLPLSALVARRLPLGNVVKMALAWVAIFGFGFLLVAAWQQFMGGDTPDRAPTEARTDIT